VVKLAEQIRRSVSIESILDFRLENLAFMFFMKGAHGKEIGLHRIPRHIRNKGLAPENLWKIIRFWIELSQGAEKRPSQKTGHQGSDEVFPHVESVSSIAHEILVAPIA
jgi:hypothetical protein